MAVTRLTAYRRRGNCDPCPSAALGIYNTRCFPAGIRAPTCSVSGSAVAQAIAETKKSHSFFPRRRMHSNVAVFGPLLRWWQLHTTTQSQTPAATTVHEQLSAPNLASPSPRHQLLSFCLEHRCGTRNKPALDLSDDCTIIVTLPAEYGAIHSPPTCLALWIKLSRQMEFACASRAKELATTVDQKVKRCLYTRYRDRRKTVTTTLTGDSCDDDCARTFRYSDCTHDTPFQTSTLEEGL